MNLKEWRKAQAQGEDGVLPSGLEVVLKKVHVLDLVNAGRIPQTLRPVLDALMNGKSDKSGLSVDEMPAFYELVTLIAGACLREPEGLEVSELPVEDRMAIYLWAMEGVQRLEKFRSRKNQPVEPAFSRNGVQPASELIPGVSA